MEIQDFSQGRQFIVAVLFISQVEDDEEMPFTSDTHLTINSLIKPLVFKGELEIFGMFIKINQP